MLVCQSTDSFIRGSVDANQLKLAQQELLRWFSAGKLWSDNIANRCENRWTTRAGGIYDRLAARCVKKRSDYQLYVSGWLSENSPTQFICRQKRIRRSPKNQSCLAECWLYDFQVLMERSLIISMEAKILQTEEFDLWEMRKTEYKKIAKL